MAEKLAELYVEITGDISKLRSKLKEAEGEVQKSSKSLADKAGEWGTPMFLGGAAVISGFTLAYQAANKERIGVNLLANQLKNVGVEYKDVEKQLTANFKATTKKTGISDKQQREALGQLLIATGDYDKALKLLPIALDLAASSETDASNAAEDLGKVYNGTLSALREYGITIAKGTSQVDALAQAENAVKGAAEAAKDPVAVLQESFTNLAEAVGKTVLGNFDKFLGKVNAITLAITDWVELHPELFRFLLALGVVLGTGGVLFIAISQISKAIIALNAALIIMHSLTGVGIIKMLAGLAIAGGAIWGMNALINSASEGDTGIPGLASGGIVSSPTLAMIGENGPEAVTPLSQMGQNIALYIDGEQITDVIERRLYNRVNTGSGQSYG